MNFEQFQAYRTQWLSANPHGVDAANTRVYDWAQDLSPLEGPFVEKAQYRCHLAEVWVETLDQPGLDKSYVLMGQGVRHVLELLLRGLPAQRHWIRPHDVYPEYARIETRVGLSASHTYAARTGLPWHTLAHTRNWTLLVCDPLKPWGSRLDDTAWTELMALAQRQGGEVWIDSAYEVKPHPTIWNGIANNAPVAWLGSLSKGWLTPWVLGGVIAHPQQLARWREPFQTAEKNPQKLQLAWQALTTHRNRPQIIQARCTQARQRLLATLDQQGLGMGVHNPGHGYLLTHELSMARLLEYGILALPPSVFSDDPQSNTDSGCVLSAVAFGQIKT